jgi:hypothetical protein
LKAPLIAVISVGIAAIAPAVAISADKPSEASASHTVSATPVSDPNRPVGPVTPITSNTMNNHDTAGQIRQERRHRRLVKRFLRLSARVNRLNARRHHRKPKFVETTAHLGWSNQRLRRKVRRLHSRIRTLQALLADRRAGLTPAVRAILERIAACESRGNPRAIGGGGAFRGKYQFTFSTWASVGGRGDPVSAAPREQDRRAALLLRRNGTSPWPVCG